MAKFHLCLNRLVVGKAAAVTSLSVEARKKMLSSIFTGHSDRCDT